MFQPKRAVLIWLVSVAAGIGLSTDASAQNPIVIENQQTGTTAWQAPQGLAGTDAVGQIKGYASATSVNKGQNIIFSVSVNPVQTYTIDVYRMGWYQGLGGRLMQHIGPLNGTRQATCPTDATTGMIECHWTPSYTLATQTSWTSGTYLALLTNSQGYVNYIVFVVRDDSRIASLLYQQGVATWQAYNDYPNDNATGKSLYAFNSYGAATVSGGPQAVKVSYDRPYKDTGLLDFIPLEYPFIRWLEMSGYDVTYSTDVDTHANGSRLLNYRGILSVGHDEYFSKQMFDAFIAARDAGVHLGFFGADTSDGKVRFEPSPSSGVPNRVVVCYRNADLDPVTDPAEKTVGWASPPVNRPSQAVVGVTYAAMVSSTGRGWQPYVVTNSGNWVYAGTGFRDGDQVPGIVGYEADTVYSQYPLPRAVSGTYAQLSNSPLGIGGLYGNSSIYQAPSGAWVFAAGTIAWCWGLDNYPGWNLPDARIQRTTANILDRFVMVSPPDFTLSASPSNRKINPGGSTSYSVTITPTGGFAGPVTLSVSGLPAGANASFTPNPATGASTLSVTTSTSAPLGTSTLAITGVSGSLTHTTTVSSPTLTIWQSGVTGWYNASWGYRKAITIDHTRVSGSSNLTNFPVLFSVTDANLKSTAYGGQVGQSNGNDLLFTTSDGVTKLSHELESYAASSGKVTAWVQVPVLSPTTDTTLYIYYGNAAALNQQNASAVWGANFAGVWHFPDGTTLSANDSTANFYNPLISNATAGSGPIDGAASFNGSNASITLLPFVQSNTSSATISFWIKPNTVSSSSPIYGTYGSDPSDSANSMVIDMGEPYCGGSANIRFVMSGAACTTSNMLSAGTWTYVVVVFDGTQPTSTTRAQVYSNGVAQAMTDGGAVPLRTTINIVDLRHQIGRFDTQYFGGMLDEVRLSNAIRSPDWIATEYNDQRSPSTFLTVGPQTGNGAPTITSLSPNSATAGGPGFTLTVYGTNFTSGATVRWGATALTTTFVSAMQVTAAVPASLIASVGTANITVTTAGGTSNPFTFTINPPPPTITSLSPNSATAGGPGFTLTVYGTNFVSGATVRWGATALATAFVSATQVTASVPTSLIATAGTANITVTTAGGTSGAATFTINPPPPTITSLSPNSATAGGPAFTLTVYGTNFMSGATVRWGATALTTTFVSATQVTASVPASLIASVGTANITVTTTFGTSAPATFVITSSGGWYDPSWSNRKLITINHTRVSGSSNLTNFPVVFSVTDANLRFTGSGGRVGQSNGNDILFTASDGLTKLNHELVSYGASSGTVVAWVQVPTVSPTTDTTIYIYYGNPSAANQQNPRGVWDPNFQAVYHFGDGTTLSAKDSTSNGFDGTIFNATAAPGAIGGGASFNGSNATINIDPIVSVNTAAATISFWINPNNVATSRSIYGTYANDPYDGSTTMSIDMGEPYCGGSTNIRFILGGAVCTSSNVLSAGTWTSVVIVYDGNQPTNTTKIKVYINGVAQILSDGGLVRSTVNVLDLHHQVGGFAAQYFNGLLAEWRLSNSIRSADWIATEYTNQTSPSTFFTLGPQQ